MKIYTYRHPNEDGTYNEYIMPFTDTDKIVELGGGDTGFNRSGKLPNVTNVDVRNLPTVDIVRDLDEDFSDLGPFDGVYACYVAEHISWKKIDAFFKSCYNILHPDGKAVFFVPDTLAQIKKILEDEENIGEDASCLLFGGQGYPEDTHKVFFSPKRITQQLKDAGFNEVKIVDHPNRGAQDMIVEAYKKPVIADVVEDDLIKINFGSFTETFGNGWINVDIREDIKPHVEAKGHLFSHLDVRQRLPWMDNRVMLITAHHLLEHLTRQEGRTFLKECLRILKPGGVIRLTLPDVPTITKSYIDGDIVDRYRDENEGVARAEDNSEALFEMIVPGHKTFYSKIGLANIMRDMGFSRITSDRLVNSRSKTIARETRDTFPRHSFAIEAEKEGFARNKPNPVFTGQIGPVITIEGEDKELLPHQKYLKGIEQ